MVVIIGNINKNRNNIIKSLETAGSIWQHVL